MGNVECQNVCPHVAALPPATLGCPPNEARLQHIPHDDCCMDWVCSSEKHDGELIFVGEIDWTTLYTISQKWFWTKM